jgi:glutathione synthase/RimK-type ligase-like ATP-grasp enzyme
LSRTPAQTGDKTVQRAGAALFRGMKKIALLVSPEYFPSHPTRDPDGIAGEQARLLINEAKRHDVDVVPVHWTAQNWEWSGFDAACAVLTWGYPQNRPGFMACLASLEKAKVPLVNGLDTIRRNLDKSYLGDLHARGAPVPQTIFADQVDDAVLTAAFDDLNCDEIVVKPRVGGGAWRQARVRRSQPFPPLDQLPPEAALIQPFIPSVVSEGEVSLLYFEGVFSHALIKKPKEGDYRTQGHHGAREFGIEPDLSALEAAQKVLATEPGGPFVYARVDLVRGPEDDWLLMELELIEPYLYGPFDGSGGINTAQRFAAALGRFATTLPLASA